jgi:hypothetical protein
MITQVMGKVMVSALCRCEYHFDVPFFLLYICLQLFENQVNQVKKLVTRILMQLLNI